jgi:hypothetical protein
MQPLPTQIPKSQKDSQVIIVFLRFWKQSANINVKAVPGVDFINILRARFSYEFRFGKFF